MMNLNMRILVVILLAPLLVVSTRLYAAETLLSLYQAALQYDAQYRSTVANTQADREEINKAAALFYPKAQLTGSLGRGETDRTSQAPFGAVDTHLNYDTKSLAFTIKQPLFNKEILANYRGTQAYVKNKEALLQAENSDLITRIAGAYFELLYAQEKGSVLQNKTDALQQQFNQATQRYKHDEGTLTEISEAQASLDISQAELIEAKNATDSFKLSLSNMTGHSVDNLARLNPEKITTILTDFEHVDSWIQTAAENNPEVIAAKQAIEQAQQDVEKSRAGHYPTLDLVGVRSYSENDSNNTLGLQFNGTTIALQLNVPLYAGGGVQANVRQSIDKVEAANEELNLKTRDTNTNIQKYFHSMQSQMRSIEAYSQAVKSSETAFDGTSKSFKAGFRTNIDVLNAQQKLYESKLNLSKAYYSLINDLVNIQHFSGVLDEAQLQNLNQFFLAN